MNWLRKLLSGSAGSQIAEAALVLPLTFMLLLGIYWFGRAFNVYATINHAAREGARAAVAPTCGSCSPANAPWTVDQVATQVQAALLASHLDPSQVSPSTVTLTACNGGTVSCVQPSTPGKPQINFCTNVQLTTVPAASGPPPCGVSVNFQYPYQFFFPFTSLNMQLVRLSANSQMKSEF